MGSNSNREFDTSRRPRWRVARFQCQEPAHVPPASVTRRGRFAGSSIYGDLRGMGTGLRHDNSAIETVLDAVQAGTSVREVQANCANFANDLIHADAYGWCQFKRETVEPEIISARRLRSPFVPVRASGTFTRPVLSRLAGRLTTVNRDHRLNACERRSFMFQGEISFGRIRRAIGLRSPWLESFSARSIWRAEQTPLDDVKSLDLIARRAPRST
jgi:hypothetical protein